MKLKELFSYYSRKKKLIKDLDMDKEGITQAIEVMTNPNRYETAMRIGAARYLAFSCTSSLRHHLDDPVIFHAVMDTLKEGLKDNEPSVRHAAERGLKLLRK